MSLAVLAAGATLAYQVANLQAWPQYSGWVLLASAVLLGSGLLLALVKRRRAALYPILLAALVTPTLWSALTTFNANTNNMLPRSGPGESAIQATPRANPGAQTRPDPLMEYILKNAPQEGYLLATISANEAAPFILSTGRAVLTFGGFSGSDPIVDVEELAELVESGQLSLVLFNTNAQREKAELRTWLQQNCQALSVANLLQQGARKANPSNPAEAQNQAAQNSATLYNCSQ